MNGLTAADLARAQGFHECAQLLSNAENQLRNLSQFDHNGTDLTVIQGKGLLNVTKRKRLLECSEPNHFKRARVDDVNSPVKTIIGIGEELECMHVESASDNHSEGTIETGTGLHNGHAHQKSVATNGHRHPPQPDLTEPEGDMCGSLHLNGSPGSCESLRPLWATFPSDSSDHLHYGHYHGFGDTAEDLEDAASRNLEQHYNQQVLTAMQLFHGS